MDSHALEEAQASAMKLAVDELLTSVALPPIPGYDYVSESGAASSSNAIKFHIDRVRALIDSSAAVELTIAEGENILGVKASRDASFTWAMPTSIQGVSGACDRTTPGPDPIPLNIALHLPDAIFQAKDYLDCRVFTRRAMYMSHLIPALSSAYAVEVVMNATDPLRPTLVLRRSTTSADTDANWRLSSDIELLCVRLVTMLSPSLFIDRRLAPQRNALRKPDETRPTPLYNQVVLQQIHLPNHRRWLREWHRLCPALAKATNLALIWARHRQLLHHPLHRPTSITEFAITVLLPFLHETNRIINAMTPFQMFRALLLFLANTDFAAGAALIGDDVEDETPGFTLADFATAFPATLIASCRRCNLLCNMSAASIERLRHEAKISLQTSETFADLFLTPVSPAVKFDTQVRISVPAAVVAAHTDDAVTTPALVPIADTIRAVLLRALADRVLLIDVTDIDVVAGRIVIGMLLDPAEASRILDKGPTAEHEAEARAFRQFWGDICTLRRFRDGTISEAVVWGDDNDSRRHHAQVVRDVVVHTLERHVRIGAVHVEVLGGVQVDEGAALPLNRAAPGEGVIPAAEALTELTALLKAMGDELPLTIRSVSSSHSIMRACSPVPIEPVDDIADNGDALTFHDAIPVVIQFESSARWPEDLSAIARIKSAVHLRMASAFTTTLGVAATAFPAHTIAWVQGFAFRIEIYHTREIAIRRAERDFAGVEKTMDAAQNARELAEMELDLIHRPLMATELRSLAQRFALLAPTVRLAHRWLNAHLHAQFFSTESIELLVAHLFLHPAPFTVPGSSLVGLMRFLRLLATYDWARSTLIVDLHDDLTSEQRQGMRTASIKTTTMRIGTFRDPSCGMWRTPALTDLKRIGKLAQSSLAHMAGLIASPMAVKASAWRTPFVTPLARFDLFIRLDLAFVPHYAHGLLHAGSSAVMHPAKRFKAAIPSSETLQRRRQQRSAGVDPVQLFLGDLREAFAGVATFYYDAIGSGVIVGAIERRASRRARPGKMNCMKPSAGDDRCVELNLDEVVADIRQLGEGLVVHVGTDAASARTRQ